MCTIYIPQSTTIITSTTVVDFITNANHKKEHDILFLCLENTVTTLHACQYVPHMHAC